MSTKVAFIGLGIMGSPMAVHLQNGDYDVTGFNRSPEATQPLVEAGGTAADSTAEAVKDAEVVCVMVPDSPDVQDVLLGEDGVLANVPKGALVIEARRERLAAAGLHDIEAAARRIADGAADRLALEDMNAWGFEAANPAVAQVLIEQRLLEALSAWKGTPPCAVSWISAQASACQPQITQSRLLSRKQQKPTKRRPGRSEPI